MQNRLHLERILIALRSIMSAVDRRSRKLIGEYGLTVPQISILQVLNRTGEISVGTLAREVSLSPGTVTGVLDRLEAHGYVRRGRSAQDKRRVLVHLTTLGAQTVRDAPSPLTHHFVEEFHRLEDWEQAMLVSVLRRVAEMMGPEAHEHHAEPHATHQGKAESSLESTNE